MYDVVDDWLDRDLRRVCRRRQVPPRCWRRRASSPPVTRSREAFDGVRQPRMQHFYERQRRRLDLLMDGDRPVGGRWSYDTENRRRLPKDVEVPASRGPPAATTCRDAIAWVARSSRTTRATGRYHWPTTHRQAEGG